MPLTVQPQPTENRPPGHNDTSCHLVTSLLRHRVVSRNFWRPSADMTQHDTSQKRKAFCRNEPICKQRFNDNPNTPIRATHAPRSPFRPPNAIPRNASRLLALARARHARYRTPFPLSFAAWSVVS